MSGHIFPYRIFSLGDMALTIDFGNRVEEALNEVVLQHFDKLRQHPLPGMTEVVPAYSSLTIYYDTAALRKIVPPGLSVFDWMKFKVEEFIAQPAAAASLAPRLMRLPVCYETEYAPDLPALALARNLTVEEVIAIHSGTRYKVYMLGFLPGFPYLGQVDERIEMPRKPQPQPVLQGSVGIAGKQTGIYPMHSPGGWQIIGRTPVKIFDTATSEITVLQTGDMVEFFPITKNEFESY